MVCLSVGERGAGRRSRSIRGSLAGVASISLATGATPDHRAQGTVRRPQPGHPLGLAPGADERYFADIARALASGRPSSIMMGMLREGQSGRGLLGFTVVSQICDDFHQADKAVAEPWERDASGSPGQQPRRRRRTPPPSAQRPPGGALADAGSRPATARSPSAPPPACPPVGNPSPPLGKPPPSRRTSPRHPARSAHPDAHPPPGPCRRRGGRPHPLPIRAGPRQPERLRSHARHQRTKVEQHQTVALQPRLIAHMPAAGRRPVPAAPVALTTKRRKPALWPHRLEPHRPQPAQRPPLAHPGCADVLQLEDLRRHLSPALL